jgi:repressor LexA
MAPLTPSQQRIMDFVQTEANAGRATPTLREISDRFRLGGHRAAAYHLQALKRKGFIQSESGKARSIRLTSPGGRLRSRIVDIPIYGSIPAGFAGDREQQSEGCTSVDIDSLGFKPTRSTFALRVVGDSMIGKHICDGDIAVFEHMATPRHGQIVAALIDGKSTLKTFLVRNGRPFLKAENPKYPTFIPTEELVIQGVFRALIRKAQL